VHKHACPAPHQQRLEQADSLRTCPIACNSNDDGCAVFLSLSIAPLRGFERFSASS